MIRGFRASLPAIALLWCAASAHGQTADPAARLLGEADRKAETGDVTAAIDDWRSILDHFADTASAQSARIALAEAFAAQRDWSAASEYAQSAIDAAPRSAQAARGYVILGEARLAAGEESAIEAAETFARAWDLFPGTDPTISARVEGRVREGETRILVGHVAAAEKAFLDVVETQPVGPWVSRAYRGLVRARVMRGDWLAAVESVQEAIDRTSALADPDPATAADLDALRDLATAAHRLYLRADGRPTWSQSTTVAGLDLKRPVGIEVSGDGTVTVIDRGLDVVLRRAPDGSVKRQQMTDAGRPFDDGHGIVWVPAGTMLRGPETTQQIGDAEAFKEIAAGAGANFGVVVLTSKPESVARVTADFGSLDPVTLPARVEIVDLDSDSLGRLVMADRRGGAILRSAPSGFETVVSGLDKPRAVAVGPFDHLYVLEDGERISVLSPAGDRVTAIGPNLPGGLVLRDAADIDVDAAGGIWIADQKTPAIIELAQ